MIFIDIDGTLHTTDHQITSATKQLIQKINYDLGIPVVLTTARPPQGTFFIYKELELDTPLICFNGGLILEKKNEKFTPIFDAEISCQDLATIYEQTRTANINFNLYRNEEWYVQRIDALVEREASNVRSKAKIAVFSSLLMYWKAANKGAHKLMLMGDADNLDGLEMTLKSIYQEELSIHKSKPVYLEITHKKASKASAMQFLSTKYDVAIEKVVAIGDNYNDAEMIQTAGIGVAMGNAPEEVKKVATFVTKTNNEEGVRLILEKLFFVFLFLLLFTFFLAPQTNQVFAQNQEYTYTRQDTLRGTLLRERACYDVKHYDLNLKIHPETKTINGYNEITYEVVDDFETLQIDLFDNLQIDRVLQENILLRFAREGNATFIYFPTRQKKGEVKSIKIYYQGKPQIARRPPWDGGITWTKDKQGNDWIAVSCEGLGASVWFPNKDHLADEPDSVRLYFEVPKGLICVANGNLIAQKEVNNLFDGFEWKTSYAINNYNITFVVGKLVHFQDMYESKDKEKLALDYYVLAYNVEKAKLHFEQVKKMLACYEERFGKYPFWRDGYALVETPYWGMEHQSAVAYGNNYINNEFGFDFIIVHESGHEYFGNSISVGEHAELWIHEGFTTYSDALFVECFSGSYDKYVAYLDSFKGRIQNLDPIIGVFGVNYRQWRGSDMYFKGAWMLHTIRSFLDNDALWFETIKAFYQNFKYTTINSEQVIDFFCTKTGKNLRPLFNQYLKSAKPPILKTYTRKKGSKMELHYKWETQVKDFQLHTKFKIEGEKQDFITIYPTQEWQKMKLKLKIKDKDKIKFATDLYYFEIVDTSEKGR
jgi:aminopeptidase N